MKYSSAAKKGKAEIYEKTFYLIAFRVIYGKLSESFWRRFKANGRNILKDFWEFWAEATDSLSIKVIAFNYDN